jgi:hypothetical protein
LKLKLKRSYWYEQTKEYYLDSKLEALPTNQMNRIDIKADKITGRVRSEPDRQKSKNRPSKHRRMLPRAKKGYWFISDVLPTLHARPNRIQVNISVKKPPRKQKHAQTKPRRMARK